MALETLALRLRDKMCWQSYAMYYGRHLHHCSREAKLSRYPTCCQVPQATSSLTEPDDQHSRLRHWYDFLAFKYSATPLQLQIESNKGYVCYKIYFCSYTRSHTHTPPQSLTLSLQSTRLIRS
jgi:hypothetical protein